MESPKAKNSSTPPNAQDAGAPELPPLFGSVRALVIVAALLCLATLLVFGDLLFAGGDRVLSAPNSDLSFQFVGWIKFTFDEMARGNLPLWNPHLYSGAPCLGGFQEALLYPPNWLYLILPLPQAINWGIALHVFLAGLFTYMWMARRGMRPAACGIAGLVFMFCGGYYLHITAGHLPNLRTMVWAPLIFLAIDDLTSTRSLRGAWVGAGAVMMQILAGHPQYVYFTALVAIPYAIVGLWGAPAKLRALAGLGLMGLGGVALSAAQLFTGLQATHESIRSKLPFSTAHTFPFPPENLLTLLMPGFFGGASDGTYWGRWYLWEDSLFIGAAAFILAVYGAVRGQGIHRRFATFFAVACLIVAMGSYTPLYSILYHHLPGVDSFRGISKFSFLAMLFIANLAAVGFDRVLRAPKLSVTPAAIILVAAIALALLAPVIWASGNSGKDGFWGRAISRVNWRDEGYRVGIFHDEGPMGPQSPAGADHSAATQPSSVPPPPSLTQFVRTSAHRVALELLCAFLACAATAVLWFMATRRRKWAYGILLVAAFELLNFAWGNRPNFDLVLISQEEFRYKALLNHVAATSLPDRRVMTPQPCVVLGAGGDEAWGNDPMVLRRYAEFMTTGQDVPIDAVMMGGYPFFNSISPMWGMVRVAVVVVPGPSGGLQIVQVPDVQLNRAQLIENVDVIEDPQKLLATLASPKFDGRARALLERPISPMPPGNGSLADRPGVVETKDLNSDEIEITADIKRPCLLLITDNYSSGWQARSLDQGAPQKYDVVRADYTLRGIPLSAGSHHFILEYKPMGWAIGKWVSLVSLIAYGIAGFHLWRHRRRMAETAPPGLRKSSRRSKAKESRR